MLEGLLETRLYKSFTYAISGETSMPIDQQSLLCSECGIGIKAPSAAVGGRISIISSSNNLQRGPSVATIKYIFKFCENRTLGSTVSVSIHGDLCIGHACRFSIYTRWNKQTDKFIAYIDWCWLWGAASALRAGAFSLVHNLFSLMVGPSRRQLLPWP